MKWLMCAVRALTFAAFMASPLYVQAAEKDDKINPVSPTMYLRGTFNSWGTMPMTLDSGVWKATVTFAANAQFKFDAFGDWTRNWGDNPPRDGVADPGGANIVVATAGQYDVRFNEDARTYTVAPVGSFPCGTANLYFRGTPNAWAATPMVCDAGKWKTTATFAANGRFKLDVTGDWSRNYGDNPPRDGKLDYFGNDIIIVDAGEYDIEVDMFNLTYTAIRRGQTGCGAAQMFLRGTPNSWGRTAMVCNPAGQFELTQPFAAGGQFKFDVFGDWTENYGDNAPRDGRVERNGENIVINDAGLYVIRFDYRAKTYTVNPSTSGCGTSTMYLRGTFNSWTTNKPMTCDQGKWTTIVTMPANTQFKFDVKGDWSENYGDNAPRDGKVESFGANIVVTDAGNYRVTFDYNAKTYVVNVE